MSAQVGKPAPNFSLPPLVAGEIRNEGQERAMRLAILVFPSENMAGEATPAP